LNGDTSSDLEWVVFGSRDFKLWEISDGISETTRYRHSYNGRLIGDQA